MKYINFFLKLTLLVAVNVLHPIPDLENELNTEYVYVFLWVWVSSMILKAF